MPIDKIAHISFKGITYKNISAKNQPDNDVSSQIVVAGNKKVSVVKYAFVSAVLPVIAINMLKKGNVQKMIDSFRNNSPVSEKLKLMWKMLEIENYGQILATTTGGVLGGLLAGLKNSNTKREKEAKYKEGIFEFLNNMTPTTMVAIGALFMKKIGKEKSIPLKAGLIFSSVAGGMYVANKLSNKIYQLTFDKNKNEEERTKRKFKISDTFVHVDDLISLAVLTKIPFADKLQVDKLLPLIYTKAGYEVGTAE